jgi:hypothetical protein
MDQVPVEDRTRFSHPLLERRYEPHARYRLAVVLPRRGNIKPIPHFQYSYTVYYLTLLRAF